MNKRVKWLMTALAVTSMAGGAAMAQQASSSSGAAGEGTTVVPGQHHRHWHHGMMGGGMLRAFHQLNLTDAQKANVKSILSSAHEQAKSQRQPGAAPDFTALSNPGDPGHAAALQAMQARIDQRIQAQDQVQQQLYSVLTPAQKQQLPQVLASMKARMAQHAGGPA
jgi:Spy/CpxP family protein refolding chaperone